MYEPEDTEARKRAETGPPEDSAARAVVAERERIHELGKAALAPANAMFSIEQMELRKMRMHDPAAFAKHLDRKIAERQQASGAATVTDLQKWRAAAPPKPVDPSPRSPTPRSPSRQAVPTRKVETTVLRKLRPPYADWFADEVA